MHHERNLLLRLHPSGDCLIVHLLRDSGAGLQAVWQPSRGHLIQQMGDDVGTGVRGDDPDTVQRGYLHTRHHRYCP